MGQREGVDCLSIINGDAGDGDDCVIALILDKETEFAIFEIQRWFHPAATDETIL